VSAYELPGAEKPLCGHPSAFAGGLDDRFPFTLDFKRRYPSSGQAKMMNAWIDELTEKIEGIRYKLH